MKGRKAIILFVSFLWVLIPSFISAQMISLGDDELAEVEGAAGVSISIKDVTFDSDIGGIEYTDTDTGNSVEFNNIKVHNGAGGPVYFDSGDTPIVLNVFTVDDPLSPMDGKSIFTYINDDWTQKLTLEVENFVFCDQDLGVLEIGNIDIPNSHYYSTPVGGVGFEFGQFMNIEQYKYTYNTSPLSLSMTGVHLAQTVTGDPTDPSFWTFSGQFHIGDIFGDVFNYGTPNPAELRVSTIGPSTHLIMDLPMNGNLRIEDLDFAGQDFGPMAIDGLTVHRLQVQIPAI
jgi:hypothetical protein